MNSPKVVRRPIRLLDPACVEKIAAGEVVERPASVVKELVENSLDAGARQLRVFLRRGGLEEIRVEDDGHGILARELPLAVERHATSKIAGSGDLASIGSFGFRGEAMAAIASVSRFSVRSRAAGEEVGARIDLVGGRLERQEPLARNPGTTVSVGDLFFNTPARREFLKSEQGERRAVVQAMTALALAHPSVGFRVEADGNVALDLPPAMDLETRAHGVFGSTVSERLRRFEGEAHGLRVEGLASLPTHTRGNRSGQHFYVNRRAIFDKSLAHAVQSAFREVIPPGRFPVCVLFLELSPSRVDVNVHPTKAEVRFRDDRAIHELVRHSIQDSLRLRAEEGESSPAPADRATAPPAADGLSRLAEAAGRDFLHGPTEGYDKGPRWSRKQDAPTLFRDGGQEGSFTPQGAPVDAGLPVAPAGLVGEALFWQLHNTFILTQVRGALVIVDQHNSHERILYDRGKEALAGRSVPVQQLLFPTPLELSPDELALYELHGGDLERVGFLTEPFGGNTVLVRGIPSGMRNWNDGALLRDVLADLADPGQGTPADPREAILASMSCHGAIRAGERLTLPEMQSLMDQLFATGLPYSCPHGRPTLIKLGLPELERRFGRR